MAKYISVEYAMGLLERYINAPHIQVESNYTNGMKLGIKTCVELLSEAVPESASAKIVRCMDCQHSEVCPDTLLWCNKHERLTDKREFCSRGKERGEE